MSQTMLNGRLTKHIRTNTDKPVFNLRTSFIQDNIWNRELGERILILEVYEEDIYPKDELPLTE